MRNGTGYSFSKGEFVQSSFCPTCCRRVIQQAMNHQSDLLRYRQSSLFCSENCRTKYIRKLNRACRIIGWDGLNILNGSGVKDQINFTLAHRLADK